MIFNENVLKQVFLIVVLNVFLSYGFLYLSDYLLALFPSLNILPADMLFNSIVGFNLLGTIFVSPISEELIFRGVFLNRLQLIVPPLFAVLISSLFFASLHSFGSITSAFIFGLSMAVLYLKTDNVLVPIFAHFLNNLIAEIIVNVDAGKILFTNPGVVMIMSLLALASFVMISFLIAGELKNI
ncbi:CPBP family intramembrane glutamic endopeptidase [Methanobrevibacter sp.]